MKSSVVFCLFAVSASCFSAPNPINDNPLTPFNATQYTNRSVTIKWLTAENVQQACDVELVQRTGNKFSYKLNACAFWEGDQCTIITGKTTTMHTLGHETRHCFQGEWH